VWITALYLLVLAFETFVVVPYYLWARPESGSGLNLVVGTVALASMIAMLVYSFARRIKFMRDLMRLSYWLHLHIFLGLQGILLAYVHCLPIFWRHGWPIIVNPGMLNLYAVSIVFGSGLFGRYLYAQVPKTLGGQHLQAKDVELELRALGDKVPKEAERLWNGAPGASGFLGVVTAGRARNRALRALGAIPMAKEARALAERRLVLEHQKRAMASAQRVFSWWIVLHRPFALAMYLFSFVHAALSLLFFKGFQG
jgi:hypothetical protein